ncbi:hypothetical protein [Streptomyces sp. B15]|uniref:hypothetical protein n=1 Tax=Streptomyces sp. B15 TaxID=1537797 RepID=UPI001B3887C3|nr:hypothetical protein [Streptomyces sp. B15]MBQ1120107.1 hypothetical protein [Streptomyces sp. B15]
MSQRGRTPKERGYRRSVLVGTATLLCEFAVLAVLARHVLRARENLGGGPHLSPPAVLVLPLLVPLCVLLTVCFALPALVVAEAVGRESWPWVLLIATGIGAVPFGTPGGFAAAAAGAVTATLVAGCVLGVAALAGRAARRRVRATSARRALGRTLGAGALAVALTVLLGHGAYATGLVTPYAPPRLGPGATLHGLWQHESGALLKLDPDGRALAVGLGAPQHRGCGGRGTWRLHRGENTWQQRVRVDIAACGAVQLWSVLGTEEHPKLYRTSGDPDSPDVYTLDKY